MKLTNTNNNRQTDIQTDIQTDRQYRVGIVQIDKQTKMNE